METIMMLIVAVGSLTVIGSLASLFGVDSRDSIGDDHRRSVV